MTQRLCCYTDRREGITVLSTNSFAPHEFPDAILVVELKALLNSNATKGKTEVAEIQTLNGAEVPETDDQAKGDSKTSLSTQAVVDETDSMDPNNANNKKTQKKKRQAQKKKNKPESPTPQAYRTTSPALVKFVTESLITAETFRQKKQLRQAINVWEQVLAVQPGTNVVCHCYEQMGLAASANKQWGKAQEHFARAAAEATTIPSSGSGEAQAYALLKQAEACLGDASTSAAAGCVAESILQGGKFSSDPSGGEAKARRDRLRTGQPLVSGANIGLPVGSDPETYAPDEAIQLLKAAVQVADQTVNYQKAGSVTSLAAILRAGAYFLYLPFNCFCWPELLYSL